uniref:Uncharacterized protein n=1 Tax=Candidatus Kentrum sp. FM TaxID=2126340 RepID=A0A450WCX3_9GAMM|nr:MAG: hypothetical protein BECKFM1743A_GA0114220_103493 [Candidatus Kentron sp. FM]VFJ64260.1 MAG: hypothetical protein BECKFM1743C_GA0114222_103642 [Candidatus Kentron sp. FM]VFK14855.1 MAG: hypothetical protein BECKFM1743B_GA0114221_103423 [Candidatus Kentron sp. FM]
MSTKEPEKGNSTPLQESPKEPSAPNVEGAPSEGQNSAEMMHLERFAKTFEASARRWEMIVYPTMFAFIILAVYGFYLVYSLTRDMHTLADSMDPDMQPHMDVLATNIAQLSASVDTMSEQVTLMANSVLRMDKTMTAMNVNITAMREDVSNISKNMNTMEPLLVNLSEMNVTMHGVNQSILSMAAIMDKMSRDVGVAAHQFARPMSAINSFFPW